MPDRSQLPFLVQLVDDDSTHVRDRVFHELLSYGPSLQGDLLEMGISLRYHQRQILQQIFSIHHQLWIEQIWPSWFGIEDEKEKLEFALQLLADFQNGRNYPYQLSSLLDHLAYEYQNIYQIRDPIRLSLFLFYNQQFKGNKSDYYHPDNSNLIRVIENKIGIPISLSCLYILVGHRLGIDIHGYNFPGHFLTKVKYGSQDFIVDCFNGGQLLDEQHVAAIGMAISPGTLFQQETVDSEQIVARVLRNLIQAYDKHGEIEDSHIMLNLLKTLEIYRKSRSGNCEPQEDVQEEPIFKPGQLVKHKKYGYRGIIVEYDLNCQADERWYQSNQSQPPREQPWYHVLVDTSNYNTYVAQSNLNSDSSEKEIKHPLLTYFFDDFKDGNYERNNRPWPY